ncbi:hydroxypyruvate isomerase [Marinobacter sp. BGYM27]|uniref:hydroxypyruvate isomerase n=1 Tax=Marinobacter sp. BGYM27 TaxID=2975597 RepID=UPI0021A4C149|nr:hydroxypyruvate isomerase [Marinobacter sp. BGYM27]MDG5501122.1 hydroxypyruvate isomerase [Marinobacter sp. BGYM27]
MPRFAANLSMLFTELPFLERFSAARAAGFSGVEYLFPYEWPPQELAALLKENDLVQVLFNLPPGDWDAGERGIACLPDRVDEFRQGVEKAIAYAKALGCHQLNCLAGLKPATVSDEQARDTLIANLVWAADRLEPHGITLMVEAINSRIDMPGFFMDTSRRVLDVIRATRRDNIKLQYDLYHMQIMEGDLIRTLTAALESVGHIQIADNPGRHEPGTGEIAFANIFKVLDDLGYAGWVSAEYRPSGLTRDSLDWMRPSLYVDRR